MTPRFLNIPFREPPKDLEIVREIYEVQKSEFDLMLKTIKSVRGVHQYLLVALSFLSLLLAYYLQIYLNTKSLIDSHSIQFCNIVATPLIFCITSWIITLVLACIGLVLPYKIDYPGYANKDEVRAELKTEVYKTFQWYKDAIMNYQDILEKNRGLIDKAKEVSVSATIALILTGLVFAYTYFSMIYASAFAHLTFGKIIILLTGKIYI